MEKQEEKVLPKLVVILGPTASGKTRWSIDLAKKYRGEIISADSRQIYKKMNIGTAKEPGEWRWNGIKKVFFVEDVPHFLLDFLDPGKRFAVAEFRELALKHINSIYKRGNLPIVAGGTGLYIKSLTDNLIIPEVAPNKQLRKSLEEKNIAELIAWLKKLDEKAAAEVDQKNKRRVIRALEVCILTGEQFSLLRKKGEPMFDILRIGISAPREVLYERIERRAEKMIEDGLLLEIEALLKQKYSWELPSMSGIGYRQFKEYFSGKEKLADAVERLKRDTRHYARRQMTWFRGDKEISWVSDFSEAEKMVEDFLSGEKQ